MSEYPAFILTHGRPENVKTLQALEKCGFTGEIFIICDDTDSALDKYKDRYGKSVNVFSKKDMVGKFDRMDNFDIYNVVVYARNAIYDIANKLGKRYILVLDDDYDAFYFKYKKDGIFISKIVTNLDDVIESYFSFLKETKIACIAFAQSGDYFGGSDSTNLKYWGKRKMMNGFFFDIENPQIFIGTINEDATTAVIDGMRGRIFMTPWLVSINQMTTQKNPGGLTDVYLKYGTYVKSFYSVMAAPSCVMIEQMATGHQRIHHKIKGKYCMPKILSEKHGRKYW